MKFIKIREKTKIILLIMLIFSLIGVFSKSFAASFNVEDFLNIVNGQYSSQEDRNKAVENYLNLSGTDVESAKKSLNSYYIFHKNDQEGQGVSSAINYLNNDYKPQSSSNSNGGTQNQNSSTGSTQNQGNSSSSDEGSFNVKDFVNTVNGNYSSEEERNNAIESYLNNSGISADTALEKTKEFYEDNKNNNSVAPKVRSAINYLNNDYKPQSSSNNSTGGTQNQSGTTGGTQNSGGQATGNTGTGFSLDDIFAAGKEFLDRGNNDTPITTKDAINAFVPIGITLVGIATIVLIIVGLVMGVKYMIAGANEKAQLKQKLIYFVISIVLVYGATGIFTIVIQIFNDILD